MNIAVLGGTFDPPHIGHLLVARQVLELKPEINKVWLLVANTNPDKTVFASAVDRMAMTRACEESGIKACDLDITRGGKTYTIDTVRQLKKDTKNNYFWIMGSDLLPALKTWQGYKELIQSISFIIFPRPDYPISNIPTSFDVLTQNKLLTANYSSTVIRRRVILGQSIKGLVPEKVEDYIKKHKLYQQKKVYV